MTKREQFTLGAQHNADNGSLLLVTIVGWLLAEYGLEPPPGVSDAIAGYVVMVGTKISRAL